MVGERVGVYQHQDYVPRIMKNVTLQKKTDFIVSQGDSFQLYTKVT